MDFTIRLVLLGISIIYIISLLVILNRSISNKSEWALPFMGMIVPYIIMLMLVVGFLNQRNESSNGNPCPEYKKIENVYIRR